LYVLPYGQMSLWGATVITNLMSAIPWVGQDIVESKNNQEHIVFAVLATALTTSKPVLPIIGIFKPKSRANRDKRLTSAEYLLIPKSFIAFLVGFIDGDGHIQISNSHKDFVSFNLVISIHINDLSVLYYIQSVLKLGTIYTYPNHKSPCCRLIFNKTELQEVFFPLLLCNGIFFLTDKRRSQFNMAMHILIKDIKMYSVLPELPPVLFKLPENAVGYVNLSFFKDWIVGFTMAEGSFFVKGNKDGCFQLKQRLHAELFEAFKLIFESNRKITINKDIYLQFAVSSRSDIQKVINFFSFSGHHSLIGLKGIQYSTWLTALKNSSRYGNLKLPD